MKLLQKEEQEKIQSIESSISNNRLLSKQQQKYLCRKQVNEQKATQENHSLSFRICIMNKRKEQQRN